MTQTIIYVEDQQPPVEQ